MHKVQKVLTATIYNTSQTVDQAALVQTLSFCGIKKYIIIIAPQD